MCSISSFSISKDNIPFKSSCTNLHRLNEACLIIANKIGEVIDETQVPHEKKETFKTNFMKTYLRVLDENLGSKDLLQQSYNQSILCSQSGNYERRKYLNEVLLPKIGKLMSEVASKRKRFPQAYCQIVNQRLKLERQNLKTQDANLENRLLLKLQDLSPKSDTVEEELKSCCKEVERFNMNVQESIDELHELEESQKMLEKISSNRINRVLFAPSPLPFEMNLDETNSIYLHPVSKLKNKCMPAPSLINSTD